MRTLLAASLLGTACAFTGLTGFKTSSPRLNTMMSDKSTDRRDFVKQSAGVAAAAVVGQAASAQAGSLETIGLDPGAFKPGLPVKTQFGWDLIDLPITASPDQYIFDISFANDKQGWIVGNRGLFLQTFDGGKTWERKSFQNLDTEADINYRFTHLSFAENGEGWITGKPPILLHTKDFGTSWERVPLSPKLPGDPVNILALGPNSAEMATSAGAVYVTDNLGRNWKAQVRETIDATLNRVSSSGVSGASYYSGSISQLLRDSQGKYLAVSSRGNFYLTWQPGDDFWVPHNRDSSRRITNMGFIQDNLEAGLWMSSAGGEMSRSESDAIDYSSAAIPFNKLNIRSGGIGILDAAWLSDKNGYAVGGSGTLYQTSDGGRRWQKDKVATKIPSNFYSIRVVDKVNAAFILGSNGVLLRKSIS